MRQDLFDPIASTSSRILALTRVWCRTWSVADAVALADDLPQADRDQAEASTFQHWRQTAMPASSA